MRVSLSSTEVETALREFLERRGVHIEEGTLEHELISGHVYFNATMREPNNASQQEPQVDIYPAPGSDLYAVACREDAGSDPIENAMREFNSESRDNLRNFGVEESWESDGSRSHMYHRD